MQAYWVSEPTNKTCSTLKIEDSLIECFSICDSSDGCGNDVISKPVMSVMVSTRVFIRILKFVCHSAFIHI